MQLNGGSPEFVERISVLGCQAEFNSERTEIQLREKPNVAAPNQPKPSIGEEGYSR